MLTTAKRQLSFLLLLALIIPILAACGATPTGSTTAVPPAATTAVEPTAMAEEPTAMAEEPTAMAEEPTAMAEEPTAMAEEPTTAAEPTASGTGAMVELPEVDPVSVTGDIIVAGSSTVFPLTQRMAELFGEEGYAGQITIDSIGTGAGFERFCNGETDISNASRAIEDDEVQACQAKNIEPSEFRVGTDALAVVVSSENDFLDGLTLAQLAQIYSGELKTWAEVDPSYPAEAIQLFSPGTDSGTFDYFVEVVFADTEADQREAKILGANPQLSEDDNVLVQGVEGSPYAIGYFGYAYFNENQGRLKALSIDDVEPTAETAESNEYPLSRPLFIYSAPSIMEAKPQVASFINYYLSNVNDEIIDVGYFPASDEALNEAKQNLLDATGG